MKGLFIYQQGSISDYLNDELGRIMLWFTDRAEAEARFKELQGGER